MAEEADDDIIIRYFGEVPNQSAAVTALTLYFTISLVILAITCKTRAWFMLTVVLTRLLEAAGFLSRVVMLHTPSYIGYVLMQCFLIISPVLLAIVEYICLGKMVAMSKMGRDSRLMRWQSRIFTLSDVVCLCIQGSAGAMLSSKDPDTSLRGRRLMLIGLAAQLGFFTCFLCLCAYVQRSPQYGVGQLPPARHVFGTLYATIALMFGRNIFRVAEFTQGYHGSLASNEVYFYVFDFTLIFGCFLLLAVQHYGVYLPRVQEAILEMQQIASGTRRGNAPLTPAPASKGAPLTEMQENRLEVVLVGTGTEPRTGPPQTECLFKRWPQHC